MLFAVGSPVLVEIEESLDRAGIVVAAGIRNRDCESYLSAPAMLVRSTAIPGNVKEFPFLIPLFTPGNRREAAEEAARLGFSHPFRLIDPTVIVPRHLDVGSGSYVNAGCTVGAKSTFGAFVFVNRGAGIGHHAKIGDFSSIGPGATIAGQVTIGEGYMIGAGATILPGITIGDGAVAAAGSVVTHDLPAGCLAMGNPARVVRHGIGGAQGLSAA